jgi:hypothetical protein
MTTLRVWAPLPKTVEVEVDGSRTPLTRDGEWWTGEVGGHGTDYALVLDGGPPRPDPRSGWQPHGVHGASRVLDHDAFGWTDSRWRGVPLPGAVLYELHIGTFTPGGTFDSAIERLDHLVELGISAVELLPCNGFAGRWGWGYDGVAWFAVHEPYGGPEGLKRFVDACHARGLGVVMDVVYNHFGPAGNYLPEFGPVPHRAAHDAVGRGGQPRPARLGRGAPLRARQRADVAARLPRRRAAGGRRARAGRRAGDAPARGAVHRGGGAGRAARQAAVPHRRERPERRADGQLARGRRQRLRRPVGRRRAPRAAQQPDR